MASNDGKRGPQFIKGKYSPMSLIYISNSILNTEMDMDVKYDGSVLLDMVKLSQCKGPQPQSGAY